MTCNDQSGLMFALMNIFPCSPVKTAGELPWPSWCTWSAHCLTSMESQGQGQSSTQQGCSTKKSYPPVLQPPHQAASGRKEEERLHRAVPSPAETTGIKQKQQQSYSCLHWGDLKPVPLSWNLVNGNSGEGTADVFSTKPTSLTFAYWFKGC